MNDAWPPLNIEERTNLVVKKISNQLLQASFLTIGGDPIICTTACYGTDNIKKVPATCCMLSEGNTALEYNDGNFFAYCRQKKVLLLHHLVANLNSLNNPRLTDGLLFNT